MGRAAAPGDSIRNTITSRRWNSAEANAHRRRNAPPIHIPRSDDLILNCRVGSDVITRTTPYHPVVFLENYLDVADFACPARPFPLVTNLHDDAFGRLQGVALDPILPTPEKTVRVLVAGATYVELTYNDNDHNYCRIAKKDTDNGLVWESCDCPGFRLLRSANDSLGKPGVLLYPKQEVGAKLTTIAEIPAGGTGMCYLWKFNYSTKTYQQTTIQVKAWNSMPATIPANKEAQAKIVADRYLIDTVTC